jgi:hypothetical protein
VISDSPSPVVFFYVSACAKFNRDYLLGMNTTATITDITDIDTPLRNSFSRASHRLHDSDPDKFITRKANRFQARPYHDGQRHYLGSFTTAQEARRARDSFLRGERPAVPKFVRRLRSGAVVARVYLAGELYELPCDPLASPDAVGSIVRSHLAEVAAALGEPLEASTILTRN